MPSWAYVVIAVIAVLAAGMLRERWRIAAIGRWCEPRGFRLHSPSAPADRPPLGALASRFALRGARRWGLAVEGYVDGSDVTIAEHETSAAGKTTGKWRTLMVWAAPGARPPIVVWRAPASVLRSDAGVADRLRIPDAEPKTLRAAVGERLIVEGDPAARESWLTPERVRRLEEWAHGGEFALQDDYAAWRVQGTLTAARIGALLDRLPEVRALLS